MPARRTTYARSLLHQKLHQTRQHVLLCQTPRPRHALHNSTIPTTTNNRPPPHLQNTVLRGPANSESVRGQNHRRAPCAPCHLRRMTGSERCSVAAAKRLSHVLVACKDALCKFDAARGAETRDSLCAPHASRVTYCRGTSGQAKDLWVGTWEFSGMESEMRLSKERVCAHF